MGLGGLFPAARSQNLTVPIHLVTGSPTPWRRTLVPINEVLIPY